MERESFVFYKSLYEAVRLLSEDDRLPAYEAVFEYAFNGTVGETKGSVGAVFLLIKPLIDANNTKYINGKKGGENGKKGGRPNGKQNPKQTPNKPQTNPKVTPNVNDNVNDNDISSDEDIQRVVGVLGVVADEPLEHNAAEYEQAGRALKESGWASKNLTHLSKVHKHWDKLITGFYKNKIDEMGSGNTVSQTFNADELNAAFDKLNEEIL